MKRISFILLTGLLFSSALALTQEIYQWVDEKGTVHFTDDPGVIPEKYQDQTQKRKTPAQPPSSIKSPKDKPVPKPDAEDVEKKDILGRGEDWWQDKVMEWREKLNKAQKDYEAAQTALKAKEKELGQSIYKPDSFKRRLHAEIKVLQAKADEQRGKVDEAKNMLENVLPRQAEEYRADPSWVKVR
jgi:hypothetical protein